MKKINAKIAGFELVKVLVFAAIVVIFCTLVFSGFARKHGWSVKLNSSYTQEEYPYPQGQYPFSRQYVPTRK